MDIKNKILAIAPESVVENEELLTISVSAKDFRAVVEWIKSKEGGSFDYLQDLIGVDNGESLGVIYRLFSTQTNTALVLKTATIDRENPEIMTVSDLWESANLYEREVYDFFGIKFINHPDMRRLFLRHDWVGYPLRKDYDMSSNPLSMKNQTPEMMETTETLTLDSEGNVKGSQFQIFGEKEYVVNIGPQHPATHGVLHLRVSLDGETVKKIDPNFGYIHRGIEKMSESYTYPQILHLADRLDYLSGTMNRHAVCLCVEKALGLEVPQRAQYIRTIFDELTRIASHLLGWGCMCMDMGSITAFIYGMRDREKIMDIFEENGGGRLMCNYSVIGGLSKDVTPSFVSKVKEFIPYMRKMLKEYHILFTGNPIARGRMKDIGFLSKEDAISYGVTGPSGRASGWMNDVRVLEPYAAYDKVKFDVVMREEGGTYERYIVRLDEIEQSLRIIEQLIDNLPDDGFITKPKAIIKLPEGEWFQRVENARGDFGVYISSKGDKSPYRIKFRSPCMTLVSALNPTVCGEKIADLIMIGASLDYVIPCIDR
ncbi:MAG: NADH-quinone oxidoreductase subunit D [Paludibacteraceae bacterium]|jgi:NADH-quinone oxidoreductase subunit C/D|nr:NADH-quinone oxidoreductase subunit D [Paludibacteraceae bacterium]